VAALAEGPARALIARAQRLAGPEREDGASVADVARAVVGLQAQDLDAASLGVRARRAGATASEVARARVEERSVARVWCMRGTLYLVAVEDARWLVRLLGPVGLARGRRRRAQMGVDSPEAVQAVRALLAELRVARPPCASCRPSTACSSPTATARSRWRRSTLARSCRAAASCVPPRS